eukprot:COSAG01_NODE_19430_length_1009_cov_23.437363_2_plen_63_part_00
MGKLFFKNTSEQYILYILSNVHITGGETGKRGNVVRIDKATRRKFDFRLPLNNILQLGVITL